MTAETPSRTSAQAAPAPRIIAFFSQKGGVGKTTACINLAAALGKKVLVIDLDPTACATRFLGVTTDFDASVGAVLLGRVPLAEVCRPILANVWLAPAGPKLAVLEQLSPIASPARLTPAGRLRDTALAAALAEGAPAAGAYVLLDCPGGHPLMTRQALMAADEVIVPTGLSVTDLFASAPTLDLVQKAQALRKNGRPSLLGFLPTEAGPEGVSPKMQLALDTYDLPCFTPIRASAAQRSLPGKADVAQRLIVLARPRNPAARSYQQVAREIELGIKAAPGLPEPAGQDGPPEPVVGL